MRDAALITGAAKRIGKSISLLLAVLGFDIALHYNQSRKEAIETAGEIESYGVRCELFSCDLANEKKVRPLIADVRKQFPNLSLLINSASIFEKSTLADSKAFDRHFNVNFKTPYILSCEFAKICKQGQIINFLDTHITQNKSLHTAYLLSKKSLAEFTKLAAVEFAPKIRVNAIAPGLILAPEGKKNDYLKRLAKQIPLQKAGNPNQIALTVQFLVESDYLTGQTIFVDGGENLL